VYVVLPFETLAENKICKHCGTPFPITDQDLAFYDKISPVFAGVKYTIPPPKLCPDCRQQRRLSFRNERKLYKRQCDGTGESIVSIYSPDKPLKVYHRDYWWSDKWDSMDFGRDFDFARPFFEQFGELSTQIPKIALYIDQTMERSDYCNYGMSCKECYLCVNCYCLDDSFYSTDSWSLDGVSRVADVVDCDNCGSCHSVYECLDSANCHKCFFFEVP
jgi:hypothetical protein